MRKQTLTCYHRPHPLILGGFLALCLCQIGYSSDVDVLRTLELGIIAGKMGAKETQIEKARAHFNVARDHFSSILSVSPKNAAAMNNLGNLHLLNGSKQLESVKTLSDARELLKQSDQAVKTAIETYEAVLKADGDDPGVYLNLGVAYYIRSKAGYYLKPDEKGKAQRHVWIEKYKQAFINAYEKASNSQTLLRYLELDNNNPEHSRFCQFIHDAEQSVEGAKPDWNVVAGGRDNSALYPVYWKPLSRVSNR